MLTIILSYLYPILSVGISAGVVPFIVNLIIAHTNSVNLEKNMKLGKIVWDALEEDGRLGQLADTKLTSFMNVMKSKTKLSDESILIINKAIAGVENVGKEVIEEITPIEDDTTLPVV